MKMTFHFKSTADFNGGSGRDPENSFWADYICNPITGNWFFIPQKIQVTRVNWSGFLNHQQCPKDGSLTWLPYLTVLQRVPEVFLKGLVVDMYVDPKFGNPPKKKVSTEIWGCFSLARMGFSYVQPFVFGVWGESSGFCQSVAENCRKCCQYCCNLKILLDWVCWCCSSWWFQPIWKIFLIGVSFNFTHFWMTERLSYVCQIEKNTWQTSTYNNGKWIHKDWQKIQEP